MALPSPCFEDNAVKPVAATKSHVPIEETKRPNRFSAYCKYCREGFISENELFQHRRSHDRCPYEDCRFNASAKVVAEHIQRVHLKTNSLVKIQDLTTPEQIEKWREERRKRYPTTANVLLRQQAQEIRHQRGEKLQDRQQRFGDNQQRNHIENMGNRYNQRGAHNRQNKYQNRRNVDNYRKFEPKNDETVEPSKENKISLEEEVSKPVNKIREKPKNFASVQPVDDSSDDDETATPKFKGTSLMKDYHKVETIVKEKAALSLLGMYGSGSDSEEEDLEAPDEDKLPPTPKIDEEIIQESNVEEISQDNDCEAPDEVPIDHESKMLPTLTSSSVSAGTEKLSRKRKHDHQTYMKDIKVTRKSGLDYSKLRHRSVNPFLEKLLQEDIRHERNVLLQCVNYVVRNNFFEVKPATSETDNVKEPASETDNIKEAASETNEIRETDETMQPASETTKYDMPCNESQSLSDKLE